MAASVAEPARGRAMPYRYVAAFDATLVAIVWNVVELGFSESREL